jgi:4-amino-4-deoxy-L-arabinose transferase-like glycosyltransferase
VYASTLFDQWLYALQVGNPGKLVYSDRYPAPIFYLIDVVWPYDTFHPISIFLYGAALAGLAYLIWRHNKSDKYILIWFAIVFIFFSFITNKEWRYVLPLFPALAIASAVLILYGYGKLDIWRKQKHVSKQTQRKVVAGLFVILVAGAMAYSVYDAYTVTAYFDISIQLEQATVYAMNRMQNNQTILVLCPFNFFSQDMISFYLVKNGNTAIHVSQYPTLPVDSYTPNFNITELIQLCKQNNVKYLFTYENGGTATYYNTTLNLAQIYEEIYSSHNFSNWTEDAAFGANPRRTIILTFLG